MTDQIVAAKTNKVFALLEQLLLQVNRDLADQTPLHTIEKYTLEKLLQMGHAILAGVFAALGEGDIGPECRLLDGRTLKRSDEPKAREYQSTFGAFILERYVYHQRAGQKAELIPLDARLALPESKFSYVLQDFNQHLAMEEPFKKVSATIERILYIGQHVDSLEYGNHRMSQYVESFTAQQEPPPADEEGEILVETADGKGVPIRRPADAPRIADHQSKSGPKPDRKKMATVASVYSIDRHERTAEQVIESLFRRPDEEKVNSSQRAKPRHKRLRAGLNYIDDEGELITGRAVMFGWLAEETTARNRDREKPLVCIMDGQESLWEAIDIFQAADARIEILDLLHVTPRIWKAGNLFHKNEKDRVAFVRQYLLKILNGCVDSVIRGLRRMGTIRLGSKQRAAIETICQYFEKNRDRMRYDQYLAAGYPIASGVIEGACRHAVKDRMERSGMNWTIAGANAMLALRCIYLSGDWDQFIESWITSETSRLHPHRKLLAEASWSLAA